VGRGAGTRERGAGRGGEEEEMRKREGRRGSEEEKMRKR
jgi:hypothetical protein